MKLQFKSAVTTGTVTSTFAILLASCSATTAQNAGQETPTAAKVTALAPTTPQAAGKLPRALWVWDATVITNPKQQADLFDFCAKKGISVVYVSVGDIFQPTKREETDPKHVTAEMLGKFLSAAHAKNLEVEALDGDPSFALEAQHAGALKRLQLALDYNAKAAANEKLDGFQWDTEPYILAEFRESTASQTAVLKQYLDSATQMRDAVKASSSLRLGYAIPAFFDDEKRSLEWSGVNKPAAFHLMDILATLPDSYIAMMAYRDRALGTNGTVDISTAEVEYATKNTPTVKVWIGQETLDVKGDPPSITFWQEGEAPLEEALGQIETAYKDNPVVAGLAIHHWASYRVLKPGELKVTAPVTEVLTILTPKADEAVERRMEITGTAKPGGAGVKIALAVKPEGDIWYEQGEVPLADNGTWSTTGRFGNENTPTGRAFEVRIRLLAKNNSVVQEEILNVKTK